MKPWFQIVALITFIAYFAISIYALTFHTKIGLQVSKLVPYQSDSHSYLAVYEKFFTKCSTLAEIVITDQNLDYRSRNVQENLINMARSFEFTQFTYKIDFWLVEFLNFAANLNTQLTDENFFTLLQHVFLKTGQFRRYLGDINFGYVDHRENLKPYVNNSRFFVQLINMGYENRSAAMHVIKEKVQGHKNFSLLAYDVSFPLAEQFDSTISSALQDLIFGVSCMLFAGIIFVPDLKICLCTSITVLSINLGVLGFLALFNVHLDIISLITILLSIGFSVDYSAHMSYHFHALAKIDILPEQRVKKSLATVGAPIAQSSLSMLIGILTMLGVRAYITDTFVLTVCLVMIIGVYHSVVLLPILLLYVGRLTMTSAAREKSPLSNSGASSSVTSSPVYTVCTYNEQMEENLKIFGIKEVLQRHLEKCSRI